MNVGAARTAATWLRHRLPEILLVRVGIALRVSLLRSVPPQEGYDFAPSAGARRSTTPPSIRPPRSPDRGSSRSRSPRRSRITTIYGFAPRRPDLPSVTAAGKPMPAGARALARASVAGGTVVALVTVLAWLATAVSSFRGRAYECALLLLVPLTAILGHLAFVVVYPYDVLGVVKGAYLQFAAPPLSALFGLGTAWLAGRPRLRLLTLVPLAALASVAAYTVYCRAL